MYFFKNYTYIIIDKETSDAVLIDPAWEFNKIDTMLIKNNVTLKEILLTHSHFDHTDLVQQFGAKYNCNIYMSEVEQKYYNFNCRNLNFISIDANYKIGAIEIKTYFTPGHILQEESVIKLEIAFLPVIHFL